MSCKGTVTERGVSLQRLKKKRNAGCEETVLTEERGVFLQRLVSQWWCVR